MKPTRENLFRVLVQLEKAGYLPDDGPISVFVRSGSDRRAHSTQYVARVSGDTVFVRISRLPFVRPITFSRQALRSARVDL